MPPVPSPPPRHAAPDGSRRTRPLHDTRQVQLDARVPALVLKIGRYPLHHGGLGAIRSLGRAGVSVYGVHEDRFTPAACSRYLSGRYVWPTSGEDPAQLLGGLASIGQRLGRPAVLFPTDDEAAIFISEHADELRQWFHFPDHPRGLTRTLASKASLALVCREFGVPCPEATVPGSRAEAVAFCERAIFPVVVKGIEAWVLQRASRVRSTTIVRSPAELLAVYDEAAQQGRAGLLLQEHLPDGEDWIVHGYCDDRSELLAAFTGIKLRSYPAYAGMTTFGRCEPNEQLLEQAQRLFQRLGYRGIMDMDWRLDRRDGRYHLLDFNPRLGAQFRLFETDAGVDVVRAQHLDLTGRPVPRGTPPPGRAFMVENLDALGAVGYWRAGALTPSRWVSSLRGVSERAWMAADDPLPAASVAVRFPFRGLRRALRIPGPAHRPVRPPRYLPGRTLRR